MIEPATLAVFVPVALALNLTPGADMMFCLGQGMRRGPRAGLAASAGVALGGLIHALAAGLGLAALLAAWPLAFEAIRWGGVGYLVYLAWQAWHAPPMTGAAPATGAPFWQGAAVNLLNPKVALFVLALVPQFVDPSRGAVLGQFLMLGGILSLGGLVINGLVGLFAGDIGQRLTRSARLSAALNRLTAALFLALAAKLATQRA